MDSRKDELMARIRERRAALDQTLGELDQRVTEIVQLPARVRAQARRVGRWTAIVVGVAAITLASVFVVRALARPRSVARRRR